MNRLDQAALGCLPESVLTKFRSLMLSVNPRKQNNVEIMTISVSESKVLLY